MYDAAPFFRLKKAEFMLYGRIPGLRYRSYE